MVEIRQVDLILKKRDTDNLYASLSVKLHAFLMDMIDPALATRLHDNALRPYSLFAYEMEHGVIFRLSTLNEQTAPLIDICLNTKIFKIDGIQGGFEVAKTILYPDIDINDIMTKRPAYRFKIQFVSVTTYKQEKTYRNWFSLYPLLISVSLKLNAFEGIEFTCEFLESLADTVEITDYSLASKSFNVKRGAGIKGFVGEITLSCKGNDEQASVLSLLLRYACCAGLGAKTALGMGGVVVTEM